MGLDAGDVVGDDLSVDQRAHAVMHQYDGVLWTMLMERLEAVADRLLTGGTAGDDPVNLGEVVLLQQQLQVVDPAGDADNNDDINVRVVFKLLQCIENDRLAMEGQELLGHGLDVHASARTAGKNQCSIHKNTLSFVEIGVGYILFYYNTGRGKVHLFFGRQYGTVTKRGSVPSVLHAVWRDTQGSGLEGSSGILAVNCAKS